MLRDAKYANNEIMNRNEPWRLWTGASPRKVKVDFSITKPHVQSFTTPALESLSSDFQFLLRDGEKLQSDFAQEIRPGPLDDFGQQSLWPTPASVFTPDEDFTVKLSSGFDSATEQYFDARDKTTIHNRVWLHIMNSIQSVRSGVVRSNSDEILNGPPIIRLRFGGLYQEKEKYILKSYNVKYEERAGYENTSLGLLPRKIDISLTLESFSQGIGENDSILNPPGWDTILVIK